MKDRYLIGEVEELLGIPRSTIQFYIKNGILKVKKNENNGYYEFTRKEIREITHLIVGRSVLNMSLRASKSRIYDHSLENLYKSFYIQEQALQERLMKDRRSLEILKIYYGMLDRIKKYLDRFVLIEAGPFHVFSEFYVFNTKTTVIDVGYATARFDLENKEPRFRSLCYIVHDGDGYLVNEKDFRKSEYSAEKQRCVYTVMKTAEDMESEALLEPAFTWAKENNYQLQAPFYLSYLFELSEEEQKTYYYELYLPIKEEV